MELRVVPLLKNLEEKIEQASTVPLVGKVMVDKEELISLIVEITVLLPEEYQKVKLMTSNQEKIIDEAQREAQQIIEMAELERNRLLDQAKAQEKEILNKAMQQAESFVDEHDIVKKAKTRAEKMLNEAMLKANDIKSGSYDYAEDIMKNVDENLTRVLMTVRENRDELKRFK